MMARRFSLFLAPLLLCLAGCAGYTLGPIKPQRAAGVHTIAVSNVVNDTLEPRLETMIANTLIRQIQQDGTYQIADEKTADALLELRLEQLDRRAARSVVGNVLLSREYTLNLRGRYTLKKRGTGEEIDGRSITGASSFFVSGSSVIAADVNQDERQAIPLAARDLAVHLVSQISEGW